LPDLDGFNFIFATFHPGELSPQEDLGTPLNSRRIEVMEQIEDDLNVTIDIMDMPPSSILDILQPAVMAGDKPFDAFITTCWAFGPLMGAGLLLDLSLVETMDLSQPWWLQIVTDTLTVDGRILGTMGSVTHPTFPTYNMHFNKTIWNELNLECPYELVRNGEWTWPRMMEFANAAKRDLTGDGIVNSLEDRWGIISTGEDFTRAMLFSMGARIYKTDENGRVIIACDNPETYEKIEFMGRFHEEPGLLVSGFHLDWEGLRQVFLDGRALFISSQVDSDFTMMENDFGVLPMPKWNSAQPYHIGGMDHNGKVFGMPRTNRDLRPAGYILDAIGEAFMEIDMMRLEEFEDIRYRSDDDGEMLRDYIMGTTYVDLVLFLKAANNRLGAPMANIVSFMGGGWGAADIAFEIESIRDAVTWELDEFFGHILD
jgi:hypothetical protein